MSPREESIRRADVVILTATALEFQAAKEVEAGTWEGSQWEEHVGPNRLPVAFRNFRGKSGRPLRVALAQAGDMGGVAATNALLPLVNAYKPICIAMCGVCAGRPGKTGLGDVIVPDRLFFHDTGKKTPDGLAHDIKTYNIRDDWKVAIEQFDFAILFSDKDWWKQRPIPYEWQENWALAMLRQGVPNPSTLPECDAHCPQWELVIDSLWTSGHVLQDSLSLTEKGLKRIDSVLIKHRSQFPDLSPAGKVLPFRVHVAPMGSGNHVIEDDKAWDSISASVRKTLGLEMEATALGALAHAQLANKPDVLVMKGVMDFADPNRDDLFKKFAARASAECLFAFLRAHINVEVIPDIDDLLISGTDDSLPKTPAPSALLTARYQVVPFYKGGHATILSELERWRDEEPLVAARLLHAQGGVGKTRLAIEWIRRCRELGWVAGFLPKAVPENWFERLWELGRNVLVVLDYAESRSDLRQTLQRVLRYAQQKREGALHRMRILLLARNSDDWWHDLRQSDSALGAWLDTTAPQELPPLAIEAHEREQAFHEAAQWFSKSLGKKYESRVSVQFSDVRFERVLYLHMAALATVEGLEFNETDLMEVILNHEERFWEIRAEQDALSGAFQRSFARQVVAAATLQGGFEHSETAVRTAERILENKLSADERLLLQLLHRVYQRSGENWSTFLPALEPDLLGEGMVIRVASPKRTEDRLPDNWIERVFPANAEPDAVRTGLELLGRASATRPEAVHPLIERLLSSSFPSRASAALEAAKRAGLSTAYSTLGDLLADQLEACGDLILARELGAIGIPHPTVTLRRVAEWVNRILLEALEQSHEEKVVAKRARLQTSLGVRLSDLGKSEEALAVTEDAVKTLQLLARSQPDVFDRDLAMGLQNLGARLRAVGRREEALKATSEAVELYRALNQRQPDAFSSNLADCLHNLGIMLSGLGQRENALEAARKSVELYRALVQHNRDAFRPGLAMSLNHLSLALSALGQRDEALNATKEAVGIYRTLAQQQPDAFQPDLAAGLDSLGDSLSHLGHREEALNATEEANKIFRALMKRHPNAFMHSLAISLTSLSGKQIELGRREAALTTTEEAVELYRVLAQRQPDAFLGDLATGLHNLGIALNGLGRHEAALQATEEAIKIRRALVLPHPNALQPSLASSLDNQGVMLSKLGRHEEALKTTEEAAELYRDLTQRHFDAFGPDLAMCLDNLGNRLSILGRHQASLGVTKEAVEIRRKLAQRHPKAFEPDLAMSLNNLSGRLATLAHHEEALQVVDEAVKLYREHVQNYPTALQPDLARSLYNQGAILGALKRHEQALRATEEAVEIRRALTQDNPDAFQADLALSLDGQGVILNNMGRTSEALMFFWEAVDLYRTLSQNRAMAFAPILARSLHNLGAVLSTLGRHMEAFEAFEEALSLLLPFHEKQPDVSIQAIKGLISRLLRTCEIIQHPPPPILIKALALVSQPEVSRHDSLVKASLKPRFKMGDLKPDEAEEAPSVLGLGRAAEDERRDHGAPPAGMRRAMEDRRRVYAATPLSSAHARMASGESTEGRRPGRLRRPFVWILVGAVALILIWALAMSIR